MRWSKPPNRRYPISVCTRLSSTDSEKDLRYPPSLWRWECLANRSNCWGLIRRPSSSCGHPNNHLLLLRVQAEEKKIRRRQSRTNDWANTAHLDSGSTSAFPSGRRWPKRSCTCNDGNSRSPPITPPSGMGCGYIWECRWCDCGRAAIKYSFQYNRTVSN